MTYPSIVAALEAAVHRVLDHLAAELADLVRRQAEINLLAQLAPGRSRPVGELVRRRLNAADRRSFTIELTAPGEVAAARVRETFAALDASVRADLPPAAVDGFQHVLDAIERHTTETTR